MKLRRLPFALALAALAAALLAPRLSAQAGGPPIQPPGVADIFASLASQPATHASFTLDSDMLASAGRILDQNGGAPARLNSITFETFRYKQPAFYIPEEMAALRQMYAAAGWNHLVDAHPRPRDSATPSQPLTDMWLHLDGMNVNAITVLIRSPREMTVIEVSGELRPIDLLHLGGHFGIPKVDPNAVMVPAPPGR